MTELHTQRLLFRKLEDKDVTERYPAWLNDSEVNRFLETRFTPQTVETCRQFVADMNRDSHSHLFGIFEKERCRHIGNIKLGFIKQHHKSGQLSLFIGEKMCWGQGYATEAIRVLTNWGFDQLGLERIEAGSYDENLASLRAFLKAGYSVEGYFRKSVISGSRRIGILWMGILKQECRE